jgi:hypothetical protein
MSDNPVQRWHAHNPAATPTHADLKKGAAYAVGFADGHKQADRIEALTAELNKAVEGLREIAGFAEKEWVTPSGEAPPDVQNLCDIARATLAEIEGTDAP